MADKMTYTVFIVDGNVLLDTDSEFIRLCGVSESELSVIQDIVFRQADMDLVIRPSDSQDGVGSSVQH